VPVELELAPAPPSPAHAIEISVEGAMARITPGTDPACVAALVREARAC
jgi:hypothetical protein